jgi:hypothetical protein
MPHDVDKSRVLTRFNMVRPLPFVVYFLRFGALRFSWPIAIARRDAA